MAKTVIEMAREGIAPEHLGRVLENEHLSVPETLSLIAAGHAVIPQNNTKDLTKPCLIGGGSRIKVNANIGSSMDRESMDDEIEKLKTAVSSGADTVMDLSTSP